MRIFLLIAFLAATGSAELTRLEVQREEVVLKGKAFGQAGAYRKIVGQAHFALDPSLPQNQAIADLKLAPRNTQGKVEFQGDFYLLTPADPAKANGKLFYEVGNRGTKAALRVMQKAAGSPDPSTPEHFGDAYLMRQGYSILWMGWQWDVPQGRMRMELPIATENGAAITGLVRSNFIFSKRTQTASLADSGHIAYEPIHRNNPEDTLTVRDTATGTPHKLPRADWQILPNGMVTLAGGFAPGQIYEVIYRASGPRVIGCSLAATRDLIEHFKTQRQIKVAYAWGSSQSGRYLRQFLYEGFNEMEGGGAAFDGVIDEVGGAGRGSFNVRFGQASRDAEQHFNFFYPVDIFPFADGPTTDPFSKRNDSLLAKATDKKVVPKLFHILSSAEYYNRGASLTHTDPLGKSDLAIPGTSRLYMISSGAHFPGPFPPQVEDTETQAALNPLNRVPLSRALFAALDKWVSGEAEPPPSQYPKLIDRSLVQASTATWPRIPNLTLPPPNLKVYQLDFSTEPPQIGPQYATLVPAVDEDGIDKAGIRLPLVAAPLATYTGWNYRHPNAGAPSQLQGETGAILPFALSRATRNIHTDTRLSIGERYPTREHYLGLIAEAARKLVKSGLMLVEDIPDTLDLASTHYEWAIHH
ncbi:alpha/beta hydrolase domain-containing protein [Bryobacter aggregatus]|uniref:alpha/beta hydrolase domain-containing protein n=1 Tax=Bryobacter aggregatus TaxID=360054 RepID=UPI00068F72DC|nr:alpha/beta hydrolase domain-containing protein [Bryobacter aggregatus]